MSITDVVVNRIQSEPAPTPDAEVATRSVRGWWFLVLTGGTLGVVATAWQTVERIAYAKNSSKTLACDINTVLSCNGVFSHWQSSALGIPNSLIGLPVFAIMASAAVGALLGSRPSSRYLTSLLGLSVFMTVFVTWYMQQSAFDIGKLCLFCLACMVNILMVSIGLTRIVDAENALASGRGGTRLRTLVDGDVDLAIWGSLALLVAGMLFVGLAL